MKILRFLQVCLSIILWINTILIIKEVCTLYYYIKLNTTDIEL